MQRLFRSFSLFVLVLGAAFGDQMHWVGSGSNVWQGFYVGPYQALDQTTGKQLTIFCLDYNHDIAPPYDWNANLNGLSEANISDFQFGGSYTTSKGGVLGPVFVGDGLAGVTTFQRYVVEAALFEQMRSAMADNLASINSIDQIYQVAAWKVFADGGQSGYGGAGVTDFHDLMNRINSTGGTYGVDALGFYDAVAGGHLTFGQAVDAAISDAVTAALANPELGNGWTVVTGDAGWVNANNGGIPAQEFLSHTPEPSSIVLFGTLLGALGLGIRRRRP